MSASDNLLIDLNDQELLDFIADRRRVSGDRKTLDAAILRRMSEDRLIRVTNGERPEPGQLPEMSLVTAVRRHYYILKDGAPFNETTLTMPIEHKVIVRISTLLGVGASLDSTKVSSIVGHFLSYDQARDGDLETYAVMHAQALGISQDEFSLYLVPDVEWRSSVLWDEKEKWLYELYRGNSDIAKELTGNDGGLHVLGYTIVQGHDEFLANYERPTCDAIEVPQGTSEADTERLVEEDARKEALEQDCRPERYDRIKITSVRRWPDTKVEWRWKRMRIGRCKFHMYWPVPMVRDVDVILYATATWRNADDRLKDIFKICLNEAATSAVIIGLVTESFSAAVQAFKALFEKLLWQRLGAGVECLVPDLKLVEETSPWRDKW